MEKIFKPCDKANMKRAILNQEETFRQQVKSTFHFFRMLVLFLQKLKCNNVNQEMNIPQEKRSNLQMRNLELMLEEYIGNRDTDESNVELTLAMGSNRRKREEASHTSDSGTNFSSSSTNSGVKLVVNNIGNSFTLLRVMVSLILKRERKERLDQFPWRLPYLSLKINWWQCWLCRKEFMVTFLVNGHVWFCNHPNRDFSRLNFWKKEKKKTRK